MYDVCHLSTVHQRYDTRIFVKECKSLSKIYNLNLIVADGNGDECIDNINIYDVGKPKNRIKRIYSSTEKILDKAIKVNSDIYHFHDPELLRIGLKLKKIGKKVIYDAHEDLPRQILTKHWITPPLRKMVAYFVEKYENYAASKMNGVIGATFHISKRFSIVNKLSTNINNYPLISEFEDCTKSIENSNIIYSGGISKERGIVEIIKAIEKTDIKLLLAGRFLDPEFENELTK